MSAQEQFAPYINRFVNLVHQKAVAKLELTCKDGKVNINISHELGEFVKICNPPVTENPSYTDVLKKDSDMIKPSQLMRLKRRALARAEEARNATKEQQDIAELAKVEFLKAKEDAEKAMKQTQQAKQDAEKAKLEAEKAQKEARMVRDKAEKANIVEKANIDATNTEHVATEINIEHEISVNRTLPQDEYDCDHCQEEFENENLHRNHTHGCPICDEIFSEYPYCLSNHIEFSHEELYCNNCNTCFTQLEDMNDHGEICIKCKNCHEWFKTLKQKEQHNKSCLKCENCWNLFPSKRKLKQHMNRKLEDGEENCAEEIYEKQKRT